MTHPPVAIDEGKRALLRALPSVDQILAHADWVPVLEPHSRYVRVEAARRAVDTARARIISGVPSTLTAADLSTALDDIRAVALQGVINATGVALHTNLGRAPLAARAVERIRQIASGYSNLEFNLKSGRRGSRFFPVVEHLTALTGAEAALVVNNNAAAVILTLAALAKHREVIVSRGELVEIGGGFRLPEVMEQSGAKLIEVGTTNRTRRSDYERAIGPQTGLVLKVHQSNFAQVGFTEQVSVKELAALTAKHSIPLVEDLGSGQLESLEVDGMNAEPLVQHSIRDGADVVTFSGDKLLGGPQAGIVVGRTQFVKLIEEHPLHRALRIDKLTLAGLEATLELYRERRSSEIPIRALLTQSIESLELKARKLQALLLKVGIPSHVTRSEGEVGGGAMPLAKPVSYLCIVRPTDVLKSQTALRQYRPSIITRVNDDALYLDVRCIEEQQLQVVAIALQSAL